MFVSANKLDLPAQDLVSWAFGNLNYNPDQPVGLDALDGRPFAS